MLALAALTANLIPQTLSRFTFCSWILPNQRGTQLRHEQRTFPSAEKQGKLRLIAAPDGRDGAVTIYQDVELYVATLEPDQKICYHVKPSRYVWLQIRAGYHQLER